MPWGWYKRYPGISSVSFHVLRLTLCLTEHQSFVCFRLVWMKPWDENSLIPLTSVSLGNSSGLSTVGSDPCPPTRIEPRQQRRLKQSPLFPPGFVLRESMFYQLRSELQQPVSLSWGAWMHCGSTTETHQHWEENRGRRPQSDLQRDDMRSTNFCCTQ